jgi:murein DD-endopeptidase MepM/ murein hydrolase activator NlpD
MHLPFKGEWFTFWGGDNKRENYHVVNKSQKGAFDFIIYGKNGKSYQKSGTRNEDYYAFGKALFAVCDATVVRVITGIPDNRPSQMNPANALGNSVMLKTDNNEYIVYAHFMEGSIKVTEGQKVRSGQYLGDCGNSGNSSEPHLHLHIQDDANSLAATGATFYFDSLLVNGEVKTDYSPVKGDTIAPIKK